MPESQKTTMQTFTVKGGALQARNDPPQRQVSLLKQYKLLLRRNYTESVRLPISIFALVFMGIFQGLNQAAIFKDIGEP